MQSRLLLIVLIALQDILAEGPPRKLYSDDHRRFHFATMNESTTLKCPIENSEYSTFVEWMKGNASLYMVQGYEITIKGHLKIKSVTEQHSGTYTCEGINGYGSVRINVTLIIDNPETENHKNSAYRNSARKYSYAPKIERREGRGATDVSLGGTASFHCVASGQPAPRIFWLKEGQLESRASSFTVGSRTHSTLQLRDVHSFDAGRYTCIARNEQGEEELDFALQVTEPSPPPRILSLDPSRIVITEGTTAAFVCDVFNKPGTQLHIKWLKKYHQELGDINLFRLDSSYYQALNHTVSVSRSGGTYKSKLLIQNVGPEDSGTYVCLALNDAAYSFKNSTLVVIPTTTSFSSPAHLPNTTSMSLVLLVTVGFVILLAVVVFVSHLFCSNKQRYREPAIKKIDPENHDRASIKTPNKEILNTILIGDPQSISKLLPSTGSTLIYGYSEPKLAQPSFGSH